MRSALSGKPGRCLSSLAGYFGISVTDGVSKSSDSDVSRRLSQLMLAWCTARECAVNARSARARRVFENRIEPQFLFQKVAGLGPCDARPTLS
jgi:hypothetical protein